jgi:hypothetical protein
MAARAQIMRRGLLLVVVLAVAAGLIASLAAGGHARAESRGAVRAASKARSTPLTVQALRGVTCFVGVRECGETPCVQFIGEAGAVTSDARPPCPQIADARPVPARIVPRPPH